MPTQPTQPLASSPPPSSYERLMHWLRRVALHFILIPRTWGYLNSLPQVKLSSEPVKENDDYVSLMTQKVPKVSAHAATKGHPAKASAQKGVPWSRPEDRLGANDLPTLEAYMETCQNHTKEAGAFEVKVNMGRLGNNLQDLIHAVMLARAANRSHLLLHPERTKHGPLGQAFKLPVKLPVGRAKAGAAACTYHTGGYG